MPLRIRRKKNFDEALNKQLGHRLRKLRTEAGYNLIDIQDMTGLSYDLLSRVERGESRITIFELMGLVVLYEITFEDLLEGLWEYLELSD